MYRKSYTSLYDCCKFGDKKSVTKTINDFGHA